MLSPILRPRISPVPFLSSVAKEIPARIASSGELIFTTCESTFISPLTCLASFPKIDSKISDLPAPAKPAIPRTSPALTLNVMFFKDLLKLYFGGLKQRLLTSNRIFPFCTFLSGYCSSTDLPTIMEIISSTEVSLAFFVPIYSPSRITVNLSEIKNTSSIRCVM